MTLTSTADTVDRMDGGLIAVLRQQLQVTWGLAEMTLNGLSDREALWCPAPDSALSRWPYTDGRPFGQIAGWVNVELMKNVAEMSQLRRMTPFFGEG